MNTGDAPHQRLKPSLARWGVAAMLALAVTGGTAWRASMLLDASSHAAPYLDRVPSWADGSKPVRPEELEEAEKRLTMAVQVRPHDGGTHETLGAIYLMKAFRNWQTLTERDRWLEAAKSEFTASAKLRPFLPQPRANLALVTYMLREPTAEVFSHWEKALLLGPYERETRVILLNVSLGMWNEAPPMAKKWVEKLKTTNIYSEKVWRRWEAYYQIN